MARILYLTQVLPYPLNTGARMRQYYTLRYLSQRHEVTLVSFVRADDQPDHIAHLKSFCADVQTVPMSRAHWRDGRAILKGMLTAKPFVIVRDEIAAMQHLIARLLARDRFEAVQADQVSMAQYGLMGRNMRRVLDLHNAMYLVTQRLADNEPNLIRRLIARRETQALARYEAQLCGQYDRVVFVTDDDRRAIETQLSRFKVKVPADRFTTIPICADPINQPPLAPTAQPHRIMALGVMFWPPNAEGAQWFAREAWPQVRAQFSETCLTIVGKNPPRYLMDLNGRDGIEVTGYVPDLNQVLAETAVFIVPLRAGGGMRVKILDAWCWGLPIVSTSIGAEGIHIREGENILIADTAAAFAQAVKQILGNQAVANALRRNGRRWIEEQYDWRRRYAAWDDIYGA